MLCLQGKIAFHAVVIVRSPHPQCFNAYSAKRLHRKTVDTVIIWKPFFSLSSFIPKNLLNQCYLCEEWDYWQVWYWISAFGHFGSIVHLSRVLMSVHMQAFSPHVSKRGWSNKQLGKVPFVSSSCASSPIPPPASPPLRLDAFPRLHNNYYYTPFPLQSQQSGSSFPGSSYSLSAVGSRSQTASIPPEGDGDSDGV